MVHEKCRSNRFCRKIWVKSCNLRLKQPWYCLIAKFRKYYLNTAKISFHFVSISPWQLWENFPSTFTTNPINLPFSLLVLDYIIQKSITIANNRHLSEKIDLKITPKWHQNVLIDIVVKLRHSPDLMRIKSTM